MNGSAISNSNIQANNASSIVNDSGSTISNTNLHTSASSITQHGDWTGGEIRLKTPGVKTFSIAPGKTLGTWLNFDADGIALTGDLRFGGMNLSDREIVADSRIEIGSLS